MGHPKKLRKKYSTPQHPWQKIRIEEEKEFIKEYGLKNKKEIWKMSSVVKNFKQRIKKATSSRTEQAEMERQQLLKKIQELGLTEALATVDDILGLATKDILGRRLQTIVFRKGFAQSVKQARQFITHKHIVVDNKNITSPAYLVKKSEEDKISFVASSNLADSEHPERIEQNDRRKET